MKEIEPVAQDKELSIVAQQKPYKVIGQMQVVRGLTLWEFDPESKVLQPAQYNTAFDVKKKENVKSVIAKKDHIYVQALNKQNAARKITKAQQG